VFSCDFEPRNGAENVSDIVQCFELFLTKKFYNKLSQKLIGTQNNTRQDNLLSFRSLVRSWTPVIESEIYTVLGLLLLMIIVRD